MGTSNFWSMKDFDLIIFDTRINFDTDEEKRAYYKEGNDLTDEAMADVPESDIEAYIELMEELNSDDLVAELKVALKDFNWDLNFYDVELKSGYYTGLQFYVKEKGEWYSDYHGCVLESVMKKERRLINEWMHKQGKEHGGQSASVAYRFSNGETGYTLKGA